ncbi:hypothetical protein Tco_1554348 [Tanacetum coccineum]
MPYPHQRYTVYNTLVNEEEPTGFTSIRHIHQEDTAYPCLLFTDNHEGLKTQYVVNMDDPNITMEEYIRLEEGKSHRRAIVFNDSLTFEETPSCEPTVSPLNDNKIDFRISFDEFDDEDYTVIYDKNSFAYKIISINDLKTDSENDNDKVNMPLFPSPEPTEPSERKRLVDRFIF